jgi:hypothetical protein
LTARLEFVWAVLGQASARFLGAETTLSIAAQRGDDFYRWPLIGCREISADHSVPPDAR